LGVCSGFTWLRIGTVGRLLWMRWWTFGFWRHWFSLFATCFLLVFSKLTCGWIVWFWKLPINLSVDTQTRGVLTKHGLQVSPYVLIVILSCRLSYITIRFSLRFACSLIWRSFPVPYSANLSTHRQLFSCFATV
jgi:hypothetical protein